MIKVTATIQNSHAKKVRERLSGPKFDAWLKRQGKALVEQVRRNMELEGKPSGSFAPLSGFNANDRQGAKERLRQHRLGIRDVDVVKERRTANAVSRHTGYARQKEIGSTPGHGKFGPGDKLRDTDALRKSLDTDVEHLSGGAVRLTLVARGQESGRPPNQQLLEWHAFGTPTMPARDPTEIMEQYEARVKSELGKLIGGG